MQEFLWLDLNRDKIAYHALSEEEVEYAWHYRQDLIHKNHSLHGQYTESAGRCPSGRGIKIVWRYNVDWKGDRVVYVISAYGRH